MNGLAIFLRVMHILPAVVAGGATVFARFALIPALQTLPEADRLRLKEVIDRRWRVVVMACIGLLLVSGLANFMLYQAEAHRGQALYHALFGVKFLMAMMVFFLASVLSGRAETFAAMRARAGFWAGVAATLVALIIVISGVLRNIPPAI